MLELCTLIERDNESSGDLLCGDENPKYQAALETYFANLRWVAAAAGKGRSFAYACEYHWDGIYATLKGIFYLRAKVAVLLTMTDFQQLRKPA